MQMVLEDGPLYNINTTEATGCFIIIGGIASLFTTGKADRIEVQKHLVAGADLKQT